MNLVSEIERKLDAREWALVSRYIYKAEDFNRDERDADVRRALEDAFNVALSEGENNAANKIRYYLRFF